MTFRASLWDEPVRPVFRFIGGDGTTIEQIAAGPIVGAGIWTGRLPRDLARIEVSPTNRPGPFDFAIERVRVRPWPALLAEGWRRNRRSTRSAVLTRLIGWRPESDNNLAWAIGATPLDGFHAWHLARHREADLAGFERPRFDWVSAPPIIIVMDASASPYPSVAGYEDALARAVQRSCDSLVAQLYPSWRLLIVNGRVTCEDRRVSVRSTRDAAAVLAAAPAGTLAATLAVGDRLLPTALAIVAEQAHRSPGRRLLHGDATTCLVGKTARPILVPGWSPRLQAARPYLRAPVFLRDPAAWGDDARAQVAAGVMPADLVATTPSEAAMPLRRVLVETKARAPSPVLASRLLPPASHASVIIPTRDQATLLRRAVDAIRRTASAEACEIVVIDNGSAKPDAVAQLAALRAMPGCCVIEAPGPFNFSGMCNGAAAAARGDVLVFLNDDTEVVSTDWLDRLCAHARDPATGAVGARLTYPDGRLQHVGVLLGMGGSAGHFGAPAPGDDRGWADRNLAVHEVSAITGACLAVAREKFEAVGGFDEVDLPIELSDIDLCLKLASRGWQTIVDPAVHIMHEESASRGGATLRRLTVHDRERAVFLARWRHVLRDDPFFHPGLSLYSWREALG